MADPALPSAPADPDFYGEDYVHGLPEGVITVLESLGIAVTEFNPDREPEFMSEAEGPKGLMAAIARSPEKITVSASGFIIDEDALNDATDFTFQNRLFILGKKGGKYMHKGFAKLDFTCTSWPGVRAKRSA